MPSSLLGQGDANIYVPYAENFLAVEFGRFAGVEELLQVRQVPAQQAANLFGDRGVGDDGLNFGVVQDVADFGLGLDHFLQGHVGGDVLDFLLPAQGQERGIMRQAAFQERIVQHQVNDVGRLVNCRRDGVVGGHDAIQAGIMQFGAEIGEKAQPAGASASAASAVK